MSTREYFIQRFKIERPNFVKVIRALPSERLDYKPHERNSSAGDIAWFLAQELRALVQMLETGEIQWEQDGRMYFGGKLMKTAPIGDTIWDFWFDAIHHRGQLTAYLRPMGGTVPSVYGPTADSKNG